MSPAVPTGVVRAKLAIDVDHAVLSMLLAVRPCLAALDIKSKTTVPVGRFVQESYE